MRWRWSHLGRWWLSRLRWRRRRGFHTLSLITRSFVAWLFRLWSCVAAQFCIIGLTLPFLFGLLAAPFFDTSLLFPCAALLILRLRSVPCTTLTLYPARLFQPLLAAALHLGAHAPFLSAQLLIFNRLTLARSIGRHRIWLRVNRDHFILRAHPLHHALARHRPWTTARRFFADPRIFDRGRVDSNLWRHISRRNNARRGDERGRQAYNVITASASSAISLARAITPTRVHNRPGAVAQNGPCVWRFGIDGRCINGGRVASATPIPIAIAVTMVVATVPFLLSPVIIIIVITRIRVPARLPPPPATPTTVEDEVDAKAARPAARGAAIPAASLRREQQFACAA